MAFGQLECNIYRFIIMTFQVTVYVYICSMLHDNLCRASVNSTLCLYSSHIMIFNVLIIHVYFMCRCVVHVHACLCTYLFADLHSVNTQLCYPVVSE